MFTFCSRMRYLRAMPHPSEPDPHLDIPAIRAVARRVALLLAKGIGEPVALREAIALFGGPCARPSRLTKQGGKMAFAEAKARGLPNLGEPMPQMTLPSSLLAALAAPAQPGDQRASTMLRSARLAPPLEAPQPSQPRIGGHGENWSASAEDVRGNLRLILGGASQ
jgi:hypothetical protein